MRYVFITGTSRGLGEACMKAFEDDRIISISRSEISSDANVYKSFYADLADESVLEEKIGEIFSSISPEAHDEIYLINNAGTGGPMKAIENVDAEGLLFNYKVNVLAPALLLKGFINHFKEHPGSKRTLTVSSGAAVNPMEGWGAYCSAKAAVNMVNDVMRLEMRRLDHPVDTATFRPGIIDTGMQEQIRNSDKENFPAVEQFKSYKEDDQLLPPETVADALKEVMTLKDFGRESGYSVRDYI